MSEDIVSKKDPRTGTEYGGVDGLVQPPPHVPTPSEERMILVKENWYGLPPVQESSA